MIESIVADSKKDYEERDKKEKVCQNIDEYILSINPPNDFRANSDENVVRGMELSFEKLCASMEEAGIKSPKNLTTFEFYSRLDFFQDKKKKT